MSHALRRSKTLRARHRHHHRLPHQLPLQNNKLSNISSCCIFLLLARRRGAVCCARPAREFLAHFLFSYFIHSSLTLIFAIENLTCCWTPSIIFFAYIIISFESFDFNFFYIAKYSTHYMLHVCELLVALVWKTPMAVVELCSIQSFQSFVARSLHTNRVGVLFGWLRPQFGIYTMTTKDLICFKRLSTSSSLLLIKTYKWEERIDHKFMILDLKCPKQLFHKTDWSWYSLFINELNSRWRNNWLISSPSQRYDYDISFDGFTFFASFRVIVTTTACRLIVQIENWYAA